MAWEGFVSIGIGFSHSKVGPSNPQKQGILYQLKMYTIVNQTLPDRNSTKCAVTGRALNLHISKLHAKHLSASPSKLRVKIRVHGWGFEAEEERVSWIWFAV